MMWKYKLEMGQHGFVGDLDMADTLDNLSKKSVFVKGLVFHQVCHSTNTRIFVKSEGVPMDRPYPHLKVHVEANMMTSSLEYGKLGDLNITQYE